MDIAAIAHSKSALCFADYACSAPYVKMNMHEDDSKGRYLDALIFSPHKFLGGPGSSGVLLFNKTCIVTVSPIIRVVELLPLQTLGRKNLFG